MQIDKDDRYVSDASHKALAPSKGSSIFKQLLKPRALILILVVALLMLIFIMSLSLNKEDNSWVVPPKIDKTQSTNTTNSNLTKNLDLKLPSIAPDKQLDASPATQTPAEAQPKTPIEAPVETKAKPLEEKPVEVKEQPEKVEASATATATTTTTTTPVTTNSNLPEKAQTPVVNRTERQPSTVNNRRDEKTIIANNHFSIQLVGSTSLDNVKKLITEYNLKNAHIYETRRNEKPWYVLLQGDYLTLEAARESIKSLPEEFQKNKAWAKAGSVINKEMAMSPTQPN